MTSRSGHISLLLCALLGLSTFAGVSSATVKAIGKAQVIGSGSTSTRVSGTASGGGSVNLSGAATSTGGGESSLNINAVAKDNAVVDVVGAATADGKDAVAIVDAVLRAEGDAVLKGAAFADAINLGQGPVIANAFLNAKAKGDEEFGETTRAFALSVATAIGKGPENAATVANTLVSVIAQEGESRIALGKSLSILIVDKGCGPIQDVIQKTEAAASSQGNQKAFLDVVNVDVNLITCAFPDTCGNDGADKRGGCCGNAEANKSGKCGCKGDVCDFRLIWGNPRDIWVCDNADCKNKKPCICG